MQIGMDIFLLLVVGVPAARELERVQSELLMFKQRDADTGATYLRNEIHSLEDKNIQLRNDVADLQQKLYKEQVIHRIR